MRIFPVVFINIFLAGCTYGNKEEIVYVSPPGYNINKPEKIKVKEVLDEISGIVYSGERNALMAVDDEQGRIFNIDLDNTFSYTMTKFAINGDYEDLAYTGKDWYVLKSNGEIYLAKNIFTDSVTHEKFPFPHKGNEFEGLCYDAASNSLWLLCKTCDADKNTTTVSIYAFDLASGQFRPEPLMTIDAGKIKQQLGLDKLTFRPSALCIHPLQHQLYILSGVNKLLVIADTKGNVQSSYKLNPSYFKQAEGISFAENGDMYISNEATDDAYANILKFIYQPANK